MSAAKASFYVRKMITGERRGSGDLSQAMERLARRYGIGFWTLSHLRKGNAKTIDVQVFERIRSAYLDFCERQIEALQQEIALEGAVTGDDYLQDLEAEAAALAEKIAAERRALR